MSSLPQMSSDWSRDLVERVLEPTGIRLNGDRPWDIRILNDDFYRSALPRGRQGILDAYVEGWWETDRLDEVAYRVFARGAELPSSRFISKAWTDLSSRLFNLQSKVQSRRVREHYDLGNDLFEVMLDKRMVYSCAYWKRASDLDEAQEHKLDLVCRKLKLEPGMRVLDIGCGFGSFARFAAERYSVSVVGINIAREQLKLAHGICEGLPVELRQQDYRDLPDEEFDAVVSLGMMEHVGYKNYGTFFETVARCLRPSGLFLLQTIGTKISRRWGEPWMTSNIFPNGMLPSSAQIAAACEGKLLIEDWHNFGADYDTTLMAWHGNFEAGWRELKPSYSERFRRMWNCYLLVCAGCFRARETQLWQVVFSPTGVAGGYDSPR